MDIISKIKNFLDALYSNKIFRFIAFIIFLIFVFYKYSNVGTGIKTIIEDNKSSEEKPQKINAVKGIQDTFYLKLNQKKIENEMTAEAIKNMNAREKEEVDMNKRLEELRKEFKEKKNAKGRKIKLNDTINIKMLTTNGDEFSTIVPPVELDLKLDNGNPFTKSLINKRVGDVVIVSAKELFKNKNLKNEIEKIEKNNETEQEVMNIINNTNILYRIKINSIKNK